MTYAERAGKIEVPWIWNQLHHGGQPDLQALRASIDATIREAVEEEREECAKVAETYFEGYGSVGFLGGGGDEIAANIRARKEIVA